MMRRSELCDRTGPQGPNGRSLAITSSAQALAPVDFPCVTRRASTPVGPPWCVFEVTFRREVPLRPLSGR